MIFLNLDVGLSKEESILMSLVGTTVFGSAISMSGTVVGDYKNSLYIGNRPYHISKGNIMGVVPGAILGAGVAIFLSKLLADGTIELLAPRQTHSHTSPPYWPRARATGAPASWHGPRGLRRVGHRDGHVIRLGNVPSHSCNISDADRRRIPLLVGGEEAQAHRGVCQEGGGERCCREEERENAPPDVHDRSGSIDR